MIQYLRHAFFAARRFTTVDDLNTQLTQWITDTAHQRAVPGDPTGRRIADALDEERPRLLPLPAHPFGCDLVHTVHSGKTPYLRFDGNDYSIPHTLIQRPLTLVASEHQVRILDRMTEVACPARTYDRGQRIEAEAHLAAHRRQASCARPTGSGSPAPGVPARPRLPRRPRPPRGAPGPPHNAPPPAPRRV